LLHRKKGGEKENVLFVCLERRNSAPSENAHWPPSERGMKNRTSATARTGEGKRSRGKGGKKEGRPELVTESLAPFEKGLGLSVRRKNKEERVEKKTGEKGGKQSSPLILSTTTVTLQLPAKRERTGVNALRQGVAPALQVKLGADGPSCKRDRVDGLKGREPRVRGERKKKRPKKRGWRFFLFFEPSSRKPRKGRAQNTTP